MAPYRGSGNHRRVELPREEGNLDNSATEERRHYVRPQPANEQARFRREGRPRPIHSPEEPYIEPYPDSDSTPPPSDMPYHSVPYTPYNGYYSHQGFPPQPHSYHGNPLVPEYAPYRNYYPPAPMPPLWNAYEPSYPVAVPPYVDQIPRSPTLSDSSNASVAGSLTSSVEQQMSQMKRKIKRIEREHQNAKVMENIRQNLTRQIDHQFSRFGRESTHGHSRSSNPMRSRTTNIELVKKRHGSRHNSRREEKNMVHEILDVVHDYGYEMR